MTFFQTNGSDSCSCVTTEDCASERVRFDDNVSFIASHGYEPEKASIGSGCSYRVRNTTTRPTLSRGDKIYDTVSNDNIYVDVATIAEDKPRKYTTAALRSQFFHSTLNDSKTSTKSLDDKIIIEVSNEALDNQSLPAISEPIQDILLKQLKSSPVLESSKL